MGTFQAVYYRDPDGSEPVKGFIDRLSAKRQVAILNKIDRLNLLTPDNPHLAHPHSPKWRANSGSSAAITDASCTGCCTGRSRNLVVLLHIFRKDTGKIPEAEIGIARKRWSGFKSRIDAQRRRPPRAAGTMPPGGPVPTCAIPYQD